MKKFLTISFAAFAVFAFPQESIKFENIPFKDILAKAKAEKKIIFIDAYASWCGPCKLMEKNIFPNPAVKDFYNSNFVNAHFDMEVGEGVQIARKYGVQSYPTFLFLNADGEVVNKGIGYIPAEEFLKLGTSSNADFNKAGSIKEQFNKGKKNPEFLKNALKIYANTDQDFARKISERYFTVKPDKNFSQEEVSMLLYFLKSTDDPNYKVFREFKSEIIKFLPENIYTQLDNQYKLAKVTEKSVDIDGKSINEAYFRAEAEKLVGKAEAEAALFRLKMSFFPAVGNFAAYEKAALSYISNGEGFNPQELLAAAAVFADHIQEVASLKKAVVWAEKSVMAGETPENSFVLAKLYAKTGNKEGARMYARQALSLASQSRVDAAPILQFLDSLK